MRGQHSQKKRLQWILGAMFMLGFLFIVKNVNASEELLISIASVPPDASFGSCYDRTSAQSFVLATSTYLTAYSFYGWNNPDSYSTSSWATVSICDTAYQATTSCHVSSNVNFNTIYGTTTPDWGKVSLIQGIFLTAGTYWIQWRGIDELSTDCPITSVAFNINEGDEYPAGRATSTIGGAAAPTKTEDFVIRIYGDYDASNFYESVEIIELDPWEGEVFISSEQFTFPRYEYCLISTSCPIKVLYGIQDIGKEVYFLQENVTDIDEADDYAILEDKPLLYQYFYPEIQNTEQEINYQYFVYDGISSSSLYQYTKIYWVTEITDDMSDNSFLVMLWNTLLNIFPISLILQLKDITNDITENSQDTEYLNINLNSLIHDDVATANASTTLFNKSLVEDNLPIWNTHIYPLFEYIVYILNFLFIGTLFFFRHKKET